MIGQAIQPVEGAIYFRVAETRAREFVAQFILIGFGFFFGVDVGLEKIHQYVEYVFFHAWSGSLALLQSSLRLAQQRVSSAGQ